MREFWQSDKVEQRKPALLVCLNRYQKFIELNDY